MPDDLEGNGSETATSTSDPKPSKSSETVDYKSKYTGMQRKFDKLQKDYDDLQSKFDDLNADIDLKVSDREKKAKEIEKEFKDLKTKHEELVTEKAKLEAEVVKSKASNDTRAILRSDAYKDKPILLEMLDTDDLKLRSEFESDEKYNEYLNRIASRFVAQAKVDPEDKPLTPEEEAQAELLRQQEAMFAKQQRKFLGATPPVPTSTRSGEKVRSVQEIQDEMWGLDNTKSENQEKYLKLEAEINAALARR